MKVKEILWFNKGLYPKWDEPIAAQLLKDFDLDPDKKIKTLSRGMVAKGPSYPLWLADGSLDSG